MALIDRQVIDRQTSDNPFLGKSPEEIDTAIKEIQGQIAQKRKETLLGGINQGVSDVGSFISNRPIYMPKSSAPVQINKERVDKTGDLNDYIMKEMIKSKMEGQDPYKKSQIALNEAMLENIKGGGAEGGDLIYRDPATGMEIPKEQAVADIGQGKQYIVKRRVATRQGVREEDVSKPEDLTQEEKQYLITTKRVLASLDSLQNDVYPKLDKLGGNKDWQAFQAQNLPFMTIGNQDIQDFKSGLTQLKADIPFLRGGKQLTATEAKRVDILLNPFGKSPETRAKDIKRFQNEFLGGAELMKGGMRTINRGINTQNTPTSAGQTGFKIIGQRPVGSQ